MTVHIQESNFLHDLLEEMATRYQADLNGKITALKRRTKITEHQLVQQITPDDYLLAGCFGGYYIYLGQLGLTRAQKAGIKEVAHRQDPQSAMSEALTLWYKNNPHTATYKALVKIALTLEDGQTADNICKYIKPKFRQRVTKSPTDTVATRATDDTFERTDFEYDMEEESHIQPGYADFCDPLMSEHISYHGAIRGEIAERRLKEFGTCCYLTRYSYATHSYRLSVHEPEAIKNGIACNTGHFKITVSKQPSLWGMTSRYCYKIGEREFNTPDEMLHYFEKNRIDPAFQDIGRCVTVKEYWEHVKTKNNESDNPDQDMDKFYDDKLRRIEEKEQRSKDQRKNTPCILS